MKYCSVPNSLSLLRIILALILLSINIKSAVFVAGYLLCGLTDLLDGYLARKWHQETAFGARLDTLADLFLCLLILIVLYRQHLFTAALIAVVLAVLCIKIFSLILSKIKFGAFSSVHTITNKLTGLLLYGCPIGFLLFGRWFLLLTGIIAILAAVEECLIILTSKTIELNRKSVFTK